MDSTTTEQYKEILEGLQQLKITTEQHKEALEALKTNKAPELIKLNTQYQLLQARQEVNHEMMKDLSLLICKIHEWVQLLIYNLDNAENHREYEHFRDNLMVRSNARTKRIGFLEKYNIPYTRL